MEFNKQAHSVYYARYHLVFVTKYRRKLLKHGMGAYLKIIIHLIGKIYPEVKIHEVNTDQDHVHLLASIPPKYSVSEVVGQLKGKTAHAMRSKFPFLKAEQSHLDSFWSDGYFVSTIGIDEAVIKKYIEHQGQEDLGQAKLVL